MTNQAALDPQEFRRVLGQFATGVTVMTVLDEDGVRHGTTISSFGSLSKTPPLVQWSLTTSAPSFAIFSAARHFAVNILAWDQEEVSRNFCRPIDRFATVDAEEGLERLPLLSGCQAWLECRLEHQFELGDHTMFVGRVLRGRVFDRTPLIHWRGEYLSVQESKAVA